MQVNRLKRKLKEIVGKLRKTVGKEIKLERKLEKSIGKEIEIIIFFEGEKKRTAGKLIKIDPDLGIVIEIHENGTSILPLQLLQNLIKEVKLDGKIVFSQE